MLDEIEKCIRFLFGKWIDESDVRRIAKIIERSMKNKKQSNWKWEG